MTTTPNPTTPSKSGTRRANALPSGCMLDEYRIDSILGAGGFGVTYKALDTHLETWVAIKEYFPVEWSFRSPDGVTVHPNTQGDASAAGGQVSDYVWGLERFLDEARVLARIQHPYVVRVKRYFRAHGTAYIVMDFEEGEPLSAILQDGETLGEDEVRGLLEDVLPALQAVHEQGYLHRDIKPANLYARSSDHRVILIDFGAAREAIGRHSKSVTSLVTPGYSPPEQYTTRNDRYGTWTDIYALGAVLYRCVSGHTPTEAAERLLEDNLEPAVKVGAGRYSTNLLRVIDQALAVRPELRFRTVAEMQAALSGSRDEDSDETVIMAPLVKPAKPPQPSEASRVTRRPGKLVVEQGDDSGWMEVSQAAVGPTTRQRLSVLQIPSKSASTSRRRLLNVLIGGGLALAALAATVFWFWPSPPAPGEKPPLPYAVGQQDRPAEAPATLPAATETPTPPASPPVVAEPSSESPPTQGAGPPAVETAPVPPAGVEPSAPPPAGMQAGAAPVPPETHGATESLAPAQEPAAGGPSEPSAGVSPEPVIETTEVPVVPSPTPAAGLQPGPALGRGSVRPATSGKSQAHDERRIPPRTVRQRSDRRRKSQPVVATPAAPVQARPAAPAPKRVNPWDKPTDTGFNQK